MGRKKGSHVLECSVRACNTSDCDVFSIIASLLRNARRMESRNESCFGFRNTGGEGASAPFSENSRHGVYVDAALLCYRSLLPRNKILLKNVSKRMLRTRVIKKMYNDANVLTLYVYFPRFHHGELIFLTDYY